METRSEVALSYGCIVHGQSISFPFHSSFSSTDQSRLLSQSISPRGEERLSIICYCGRAAPDLSITLRSFCFHLHKLIASSKVSPHHVNISLIHAYINCITNPRTSFRKLQRLCNLLPATLYLLLQRIVLLKLYEFIRCYMKFVDYCCRLIPSDCLSFTRIISCARPY